MGPLQGVCRLWPCGRPSSSSSHTSSLALPQAWDGHRGAWPCCAPHPWWLRALDWGLLTICPLSQAARVRRAGADPGGPNPALCAGFQPNRARVEAGLRAAGVVRQPRAEVCAGAPGPVCERAAGVGGGSPGPRAIHAPSRSPAPDAKSFPALEGSSQTEHCCAVGPAGRRGLWEGALRRTGSRGRGGVLGAVAGHTRGEEWGARPAECPVGAASAEPWASFPGGASAKPFLAQDFISKSN